MPATDAMPTSRSPPRARIGAAKGWKVTTMPSTLVRITRSKAGRSSASSVSVPTDTPALAITTSGRLQRAECLLQTAR